jgi:hypothetical protein
MKIDNYMYNEIMKIKEEIENGYGIMKMDKLRQG